MKYNQTALGQGLKSNINHKVKHYHKQFKFCKKPYINSLKTCDASFSVIAPYFSTSITS